VKITKKADRAVILDAANYAQLLFPDFSLILCGYLICRYTALNRTVWEPVESLVYYFMFPVLLFHSIIKSPLDFGAASSLIAAGLLLVGSGIALAYAVPHLPWIGRHIQARDHAASAQVVFRYNSFIGLALAGKLAGPEGLLLISVLIGVSVPLSNIGAVWPMARHANLGLARELVRNPLILGTAAGLITNVLGFHIPVWLEPRQATVMLMFSALPTASSCYVLAARMGYNAAYVGGLGHTVDASGHAESAVRARAAALGGCVTLSVK
jgi:malonate transporter